MCLVCCNHKEFVDSNCMTGLQFSKNVSGRFKGVVFLPVYLFSSSVLIQETTVFYTNNRGMLHNGITNVFHLAQTVISEAQILAMNTSPSPSLQIMLRIVLDWAMVPFSTSHKYLQPRFIHIHTYIPYTHIYIYVPLLQAFCSRSGSQWFWKGCKAKLAGGRNDDRHLRPFYHVATNHFHKTPL